MRTLTTWIACLACFLTGLGGATGAVLCIGADGHLELEAPDHDCCCETGEADHHDRGGDQEAFAPHDDHCTDCLDLDIPIPRRKAARERRGEPEHAESCCRSGRTATDLSDVPEAKLLFRPPPEGESTLASLRTVILLN